MECSLTPKKQTDYLQCCTQRWFVGANLQSWLHAAKCRSHIKCEAHSISLDDWTTVTAPCSARLIGATHTTKKLWWCVAFLRWRSALGFSFHMLAWMLSWTFYFSLLLCVRGSPASKLADALEHPSQVTMWDWVVCFPDSQSRGTQFVLHLGSRNHYCGFFQRMCLKTTAVLLFSYSSGFWKKNVAVQICL